MYNGTNIGSGVTNLIVSVLTGIIAWMNGISVGEFVKIVSGIISAVAGLMAIRHFYYSTKKLKP